jgi:hypothetical protein
VPYVVKWVSAGQKNLREWPTTFPTPSEAIDFARAIFSRKPREIWIEGPEGLRIERDAIVRASRDRGSGPP